MRNTRIVWPTDEPIHLEGESDAYASERFDAAYDRLWYVACQVGGDVDRRRWEGGGLLFVYTQSRVFRLTFGNDDRLQAIDWRAGLDPRAPWRALWPDRSGRIVGDAGGSEVLNGRNPRGDAALERDLSA